MAQLLTIAEYAARFKIEKISRVYELIRKGEIDVVPGTKKEVKIKNVMYIKVND